MDKNGDFNKLEQLGRSKKTSRKTGRRFLTPIDMAVAKHDTAVRNAEMNRAGTEPDGVEHIHVCGCGREGCLFHSGRIKAV